MSRRLVLVAIALLAVTASAPAATTSEVRITAIGFDPADVSAVPGEGIHWTNVHLQAQSVTSDSGLFDSGLVPPGGGYSMSLSIPGVHTYTSSGNPALEGTIRVVSPTLPGQQGDLAADGIPNVSFPPPRATEIAAHPLYGVDASTRRILLGVRPDATVGDVNEALGSVDATVIGGLPGLDVLLVQVAEDPIWAARDDGGTEVELQPLGRFTGLAAALTRLRGSTAFAFVAMSSAIDTAALPRRAEQTVEGLPGGWPWETDGGANWGLKDARFPFAWNLRESLARDEPKVVTGVIDAGFHAHPDLSVDLRERLCPSGGGACVRLPNNGTVAQKDHGTHVAGIIGAAWDNPAVAEPPRSSRSKGVSGGNPFARTIGTPFASEHLLEEGVELFDVFLRSRPEALRVINYSARLAPPVPATLATTFPNASCGPGTADDDLPGFENGTKFFCTPAVEDGWLRELAHAGMTSRWVAEAAAREGVVIVAAAGNENARYCIPWGQPDCHHANIRAHHASEWAWAARNWKRDDLPNPIVVVEATRPDGTLAPYSNPGGDVAAPGSGVGSTLGSGGYGVLSGTSMATPHVTAAIGQLLAAEPDLTIEDVRERVVDWGRRPPARNPLPTNVFDWHVPDHLGQDANLDEIVDAHEFVDDIRRPGYPVDLDACEWSVGGDPIVLFTWTLNGETIESTSCQLRYTFPAEGEYAVTVTFTDADGDDLSGTRTVKVDDLLVVALGDAVASGEGAPDASGSSAFTSAKWQNQRCHRSAKGGFAQAPRWLEIANSESSVTFLNLACSGARIRGDLDGTGTPVGGPDGEGGLLTPYRGLEWEAPSLPPQADELQSLVGSRAVDALLLSAGANDVHLREILSDCLLPANNCSTGAGRALFEQRLALLPARYDELAAKLDDDGIAAGRVFVTELPDFTRSSAGTPDLSCLPGTPISAAEAVWLGQTVLADLSAALTAAATRHGWTRVATPAGFGTHGACSSEPWVHKATAAQLESWRTGSAEVAGLFHANGHGQAEIGRSFVAAVRAELALGDVNPRRVFGDAAPRLDVFASLLKGDGVVTRLVDVNDPSLDGNRRVIRGLGAGGELTTSLDRLLAHGEGERSEPDGFVDMRDFRRFRDAWLSECALRSVDTACPADASEIVLDGGDEHPKKDLNFDGCVWRAGDVAGCGAAEHRFSRFDFNGDGFTSVERKAFVPLTAEAEPAAKPEDGEKLTDLDLLRARWAPDPRDDEGWEDTDLDRLLRSADVTVHAGRLLAHGAREGEIQVRTVGGEDVGPPRTLRRSSGSIVVTVPVTDPDAQLEVVGTATTARGVTEVHSAPFTLRYGEDARADLCSGLTLESTATRLPRDGQAAATLTGTLHRCGGELDGKDVSWSVSPEGPGGPQLAAETTATDSDGRTSVGLVAGTEAGDYTVKAVVDLGLGESEEAELAIELVRPLVVRYVWKQMIDEWSEQGSTKWEPFSDPQRPDCLTAEVEYCIDSYSIGLDPDTPYELERSGRLTGIDDTVTVTQSVEGDLGRSRSSWVLSRPNRTTTESGEELSEWKITEPDRYQNHPLENVTVTDEEEGVHLRGLQAVGDLPYPYSLVSESVEETTPDEIGSARSEFLLIPQAGHLRFAAHPEQELVFRRDGAGFEEFVSCGRLEKDLTTEPGYLVQEEGDEYLPVGLLGRKPEFEPGDRPMPVGPGSLRVRYAFAATVGYDDEEPPLPELPDCDAAEPPVANFELPPEPIDEGEVVRFSDRSTDADHDIEKYEWETSTDAWSLSLADFDREPWSRTAGSASPAFVFRDDGPVTVKLTVTDSAGDTATAEKQLTVLNVPPEASIDDATGRPGEPVSLLYRALDRGASDRAALRVRLTSTNPNWPTHDRVEPAGTSEWSHSGLPAGVYPLTLTVTDPDGAFTRDSATLVVSTAPPDEEPPAGPSSPTCDPAVVLDAEERDFLELVNDYRELNGLPPVAASPSLTRAAERHAQDMADNDFLAHDGSDGSSPVERAHDAGYPTDAAVSENLAEGETGFDALWNWRSSSAGHNENLLVPEWRAVGISRLEGSTWRWATSYGNKLDCSGAGGTPASAAAEAQAPESTAALSGEELSSPTRLSTSSPEASSFRFSFAADGVEETSLAAVDPPVTPPTIAFTLSDATPREGVPVVFTNRTRDLTGAPIGATVELDGATQLVLGPNESASHTFTTPGAHSARAFVGEAELTRPIEVAAKIPLALDYIGPTTAYAGGRLDVLARADDSTAAVPVPGAELTFELAGASATATSGADGRAGALLAVPGTAGSYELTVRFAGNDDYLPAETTATIDVLANALPVPHPGGPYVVGEGQSLFLDGTRSRDPDAGDRVLRWQWDLNGDGSFDDATGATPAALPWSAIQLLICGGSCEVGRAYPIALRAEDTRGAAATASTTLTFTSDFSVVMAGGTITLVPGASNHFGLTVVGSSTWTHPVTLSVQGLPEGVTASFSRNPVTPTGTSVLTLTASSSVTNGTSAITVTGTGNGVTRVAGAEIDVTFGLIPVCFGANAGIVTDRDTGQPLADAPIFHFGNVIARTDENGRYVVDRVQLGFNNAPVTRGLTAAFDGYWEVTKLAEAACGVVTQVDFPLRLKRPGRVSGRVIDKETRLPIAAATATFHGAPIGPVNFTSDADGRFAGELELNPENAPRNYTAQATAPQYWPHGLGGVVTASADTEATVAFELVRVCYATFGGGIVHRRNTQIPVANAIARLNGPSGVIAQIATDAEGRFRFDRQVPLGQNNQPVTYTVSVSPPIGSPPGSEGGFQNVAITQCGQLVPDVGLTVYVPTQNFGDVEGHVRDEETGEPIAGASVSVDSSRFTTTDANGYYRFDDLFVGNDHVLTRGMFFGAGKQGYYSSNVTRTIAANTTTTVDLILLRARQGHGAGTVTDVLTGAPIEGALISSHGVSTDRDGAYGFSVSLGFRNAPVVGQVSASALGYWPAAKPATFRADETTVTDLALIRECTAARVSGRVVNAVTQEPIPGAVVQDQFDGRFAVTDATGRFLLTGLRAGVNNAPLVRTLTAFASGFNFAQRQITVFCGANIVVDFGSGSSNSASIAGTVTNLDTGQPVAGAVVGAEFGAVATTDATGGFRFASVPLGHGNTDREWKVTALVETFRPTTVAVVVRANQESRADIGLTKAGNTRPVADPKTYVAHEDVGGGTPQPLTLTGSDADGDAVTFHIVRNPLHGRVRGLAPNVDYVTTEANYNGPDSFEYVTFDGQDLSERATVDITVLPVNDAPRATNDVFQRPIGAPARIPIADILANDSDADGDPLSISSATAFPPAQARIEGTELVVTPTASQTSARILYSITDGKGGFANAQIDVTFVVMPLAPVCAPATFRGPQDAPLSGSVQCSDGNGDALTYALVRAPAVGTLSFAANGTFQYVPPAGFTGETTFDFRASDGTLTSEPATATLVLEPTNRAPVATDASVLLDEDTPTAMTLAATDVDGDSLTFSVVTGPAHGSLGGTAPNLTYTPAANYHGPDSFVFRASDDSLGDNAVVSISVRSVNDPPLAADDAASTAEDEPLELQPAALLANDGDVDGDTLTLTAVGDAAHGTVTLEQGTIRFTPAPGFNGEAGFRYTLSDGQGGTATAGVEVTVAATNDAPLAADASVTLDEDTPTAIVLAATDADGDTLSFVVVTPPAHGSLSGTAPNLTYTPAANYHGPDSFTFRASDGALSDDAAVSITVRPVNDPPSAADDTAETLEDEPLELLSATLLANDGDVDGDTLSLTAVGEATHGTVALEQGTIVFTPAAGFAGAAGFGYTVADTQGETATARVSVTVSPENDAPLAADASAALDEDTSTPIVLAATDADDDALAYSIVAGPAHGSLSGTAPSLTYTPAANYHGPDSLTFRASDGSVGDDATVSITVRPVNDPPSAADDTAATSEDEPLVLTHAELLANDSDVEGETLTVTAVGGATHGTVALEQSTIRFTPVPGFSGQAAFTYTISDGQGGTGSAGVAVTVAAVNRPPAVELAGSGPVDEATPVSLSASASDPDGDALIYSWRSTAGELTGTGANASLLVDDGPAQVTVTVRVTDPDGVFAEASTVVEVTNVRPTADAGSDRNGHWGRPIALTGSVSDPSRADTAAGLDPRWSSGATGLTTELTFSDPGSYTASLTATDKDGDSTTDAAQVRVDLRGTSVTWTGQVTDAALGQVRLSARLSDLVHAPTARLADRTIAFEVGGQVYTATTDALGDAQVGLPVVLLAGTHSIRIAFAADSHYLASESRATVTVGEAPRRVLLLLDENSLDNGAGFNPTGGPLVPWGPSFFGRLDVNGDRAGATQRAVLRYFAANIGATITVGTGQTGDEGWFAPSCVPQGWLTGTGSGCLEGATRDEAIGRFFGSRGPSAIPSQSRLEAVPAVMPLRARGLSSLTGATVCAVVYDGDVALNYSSGSYPYTSGSLKGATLGVVAFDVKAVRRLSGFSSSTLPEVQLTIRDTATCGGWALLNAPVPRSTSVPNDVDPARPAGTGSNGYRSLAVRPAAALVM